MLVTSSLEGPTGESWSYSVAGSKVVSPDSADIYAEARAHGGPSISLVACSKADAHRRRLHTALLLLRFVSNQRVWRSSQ